MREFTFGKNKYYESADNHYEKESEKSLMKYKDIVARHFIKRRLFNELIEVYGKRTGLEGYIILQAHGAEERGRWIFMDGKRKHIMQNWIKKIDGEKLFILLECCNPGNLDISSDESIVIHANKEFNLLDLTSDGHKRKLLRIYIPGIGYLEKDFYRLRRTIDSIK